MIIILLIFNIAFGLCYHDICNKIKFENIEESKKTRYSLIIQYTIKKLDENLKYDVTFSDVIKGIHVFSGGDKRGYATHTSIYINVSKINSYKEFFNVLIHELGHIFDLGILRGSSKYKNYDYTEFGRVVFSIDDPSIEFYSISWLAEGVYKNYSYLDFVTGYGMQNPFEDFAESFNAYLNYHEYFKYLAMNNYVLRLKFEYFDKYFNGFHFRKGIKFLEKAKNSDFRRPWDTTYN